MFVARQQDTLHPEKTDEPGTASAVAPRVPAAELLLGLQRSAGNQAVARLLLQRQEAPAAADADTGTSEANPFENEVYEEEAPPEAEPELGLRTCAKRLRCRRARRPPPVPGGAEPKQFQAPAPDKGAVLARRVMMVDSTASGGWREMTRGRRESFVRARFRGRRRRIAYEVLRDMAAASNELNFDTEDELHNEVLKRVTSSMIMQDTQDGERHTNAAGQSNTVHAFGYPFTGGSLLYGARVNYAAKDYWTPNPPDGYAVRRDAARNRTLRGLPRGQRHTVYGDADDYSFDLTAAGQADFFSAVTKLFVPQPPHKRSLIHCDYLISLVHLRSFAATIGQAEFNRRATTYGTAALRLTWDLFSASSSIRTAAERRGRLRACSWSIRPARATSSSATTSTTGTTRRTTCSTRRSATPGASRTRFSSTGAAVRTSSSATARAASRSSSYGTNSPTSTTTSPTERSERRTALIGATPRRRVTWGRSSRT
jgi:hypothetical protein